MILRNSKFTFDFFGGIYTFYCLYGTFFEFIELDKAALLLYLAILEDHHGEAKKNASPLNLKIDVDVLRVIDV